MTLLMDLQPPLKTVHFLAKHLLLLFVIDQLTAFNFPAEELHTHKLWRSVTYVTSAGEQRHKHEHI